MTGFKPHNRGNPCPVCRQVDNDCKSSLTSTLVLCHSHISFDPDIAGWVYRGESSIGVWGRFYPDEGKEGSFDRAEWEREQKELKRQRQKACKDALDRDSRNIAIRQLHKQIWLTRADRDRLINRGLTVEQIEKGLFFSKSKYQDIPKGTPLNLPGVDANRKKLAGKDVGIVCPAFDYQGRAIGWQLRVKNAVKNKYKWAYGVSDGKSISSDLPNGEKPITIVRKSSTSKTLYVSEGFLKPYIAANRHNLNVMGSPNAQFIRSPQQVKENLSLGYEQLVICPDAGDVSNPDVMKRWRRQISFLEEFGLEIKVAWWGQFSKNIHADIDEIDSLKDVDLISTEEFLAIGDRFCNELWKKWLNSRKFTPHQQFEQPYFSYQMPDKNTILAVKSDMGTGKTTEQVRWLKEFEKKHGIIALGYRNTLLHQYCAQTDSYHIHEQEAKMMIADERSKIALCVDSLVKFEPEDFNNRVIVIDEATSVIPHLLTSSTIPEYNREQIIYLFGEAIKRADRVILLDGNMRDWVVDYVSQYAPNKQIVKVENTFKANQDRKVIFYSGSLSAEGKINKRDQSPIRDRVYSARRPLLVMDNQDEAENYHQILSSQKYKVLRVDRTTSGTDEVKEFLTDCDAYLAKHQPDAVIMTPSAESGIDISIKDYFSDIFVLAYGLIGVNSIRQISTRLRDKNAQMHLWVNPRPVIDEELEPELLIEETVNELRYQKVTGLTDKDAQKIRAILKATVEREAQTILGLLKTLKLAELRNYRDCLKTAFLEAGFLVDEFVGESNKLINQEFSEVKKSIYIERSVKTFNAPDIPEEQLNYPQKFNASPEEVYARQKAVIKKLLPGIELTDIWSPDFIYNTQYKHRNYIHSINTQYLFDHPEIAKQLNSKALAKRYRQAGVIENMSLYNLKLRGLIALKLREAGIDKIVNAPKGTEFCDESPEIIEIFRKLKRSPVLRKQLDVGSVGKKPIRCVNSVLPKLNKCLVLSRSERVGTKTIRYYRLNEKHLDQHTAKTCYECCDRRWKKWLESEIENLASEVEKNQKKVGYSDLFQLLTISRLASVSKAYDLINKSEVIPEYKNCLNEYGDKIMRAIAKLKAKIYKTGFQNERISLIKSIGDYRDLIQVGIDTLIEVDWQEFSAFLEGVGDYQAYQVLCSLHFYSQNESI
ncbi:MAG: plasmid replication protein, CyRepA1 family [Waterburya sp.]